MTEGGRARVRRESLGIVFQQFNLIPSLTVAQNLTFQARLAGRENAGLAQRLADALGIADQLAKYPEDLSGGQQQRVAIGRALAAAPRILLADEPTGNLDEDTADRVFALMRDLARESGAALLVATHSERLAAQTSRRLHLSRGRLA
jgi:putative ABC transport system ATP-binding protein